jgi:Tol biopolymer transport system component
MRFVLLPTGAGEARNLPGGPFLRLRFASFFPDGRRILFANEDKSGGPRSYVQDLEGGAPQPFGEEGVWPVLISPDGQWIAGTTTEGHHVIYRSDGKERPRPIEGALPEDVLLRWSSDGKKIYVRGAEEQPLTLYRIDLATGRRERWRELTPPDLTGFQAYAKGPGAVCVTPDGQYYAYTVLTDSSRLVVTEAGPDWWK